MQARPEPSGQALAQLESQRQQLRSACQAASDAAGKLARLREELLGEAEGQLLDLAVEIARKVLMQEIQAGRYEIEPIVKEALLHVPVRQDVVVRLHPDDWARCQMAHEGQDSGCAGRVRFIADPTVPRAECVLETAEGTVESSPEKHLATIVEALKGSG